MIKLLVAGAVALAWASTFAHSAEVEIKMLNKGEKGAMVFEPASVRIQPGDTVKFVPTDKSHNAETIAGMLPEGSTPFAGKLNQEISITFEKAGVYGFKCKPHYSMGMVGIVVVGDSVANIDAAKAVKHPGKAKKVFAELLDAVATP